MANRFSVGLNCKVTGKCDHTKLSYGGAFVPREVTIADLSAHISKGHPWMPALLDSGSRRVQESCNKAFCLALDVDNSDVLRDGDGKTIKDEQGKAIPVYRQELTIEQALDHPYLKDHCCLIQPSASHNPEWNKFRLVFLLPEPIEHHNLIRICNRYLKHIVGFGDAACKDASRFFFGAPGSQAVQLQEVRLPDNFVADALSWDAAIVARQEAEAEARRECVRSLRQDSRDQISMVRSALSHIPPHTPGQGRYPDLIAMCAGVVNDLGFEGENLLIEWNGFGRDTEKKVRGLSKTANKTATLGSLFHLAKQEGYRFPKRTAEEKRIYAKLKSEERAMAAKKMSSPTKAIEAPVAAVEATEAYLESEEYKEAVSDFEESERHLKDLAESRFSDAPESFWLGSGKIYQVCGGRIRPNIRNGWMAQAITIAQLLATLTPADARIVTRDKKVSMQPIPTWVMLEAPTNSGKTAVSDSIEPFENAFEAIDDSRRLDIAKLKREIDKIEKDQKNRKDGDKQSTPLPDDVLINRHLHNVEMPLSIGMFSQAGFRDARAAVVYWPKISKQLFFNGIGYSEIKPKNLLIRSREGVAMLKTMGGFNQDEVGFKAEMCAAWSAETTSQEVKRTEKISIKPPKIGQGLLISVQEGTLAGLMQTEIRLKAGVVNTGFTSRFLPCVLLNTEGSQGELFFEEAGADDASTVPTEDMQSLMEQFMRGIEGLQRISCDSEATAYYGAQFYGWMNIRLSDWNAVKWSNDIQAKFTANVFRLAWAFRCMEMFDGLAAGLRLEPVITATAMAKAIEYVKHSEACFAFELVRIAKTQDYYERSREAEKQQSILQSKYYNIFTTPELTHQWTQEQQRKGVRSIRGLRRKLNNKTLRELRDSGIDVNAVLKAAWDRIEASVNCQSPMDAQAESYEYTYHPEEAV